MSWDFVHKVFYRSKFNEFELHKTFYYLEYIPLFPLQYFHLFVEFERLCSIPIMKCVSKFFDRHQYRKWFSWCQWHKVSVSIHFDERDWIAIQVNYKRLSTQNPFNLRRSHLMVNVVICDSPLIELWARKVCKSFQWYYLYDKHYPNHKRHHGTCGAPFMIEFLIVQLPVSGCHKNFGFIHIISNEMAPHTEMFCFCERHSRRHSRVIYRSKILWLMLKIAAHFDQFQAKSRNSRGQR